MPAIPGEVSKSFYRAQYLQYANVFGQASSWGLRRCAVAAERVDTISGSRRRGPGKSRPSRGCRRR